MNNDPAQLLAALTDAAEHLMAGGLVAFPTETVYGLGANAEDPTAVDKIYLTKGRPKDHPLIIHIAHSSDAKHFATEIPEYAHALMRDYWPGPMTLILRRSGNAGDFVTGKQDTVGLRIPDHPVALALLLAFRKAGGNGLAAPSANRYGSVSPTTANAVVAELGDFLEANDIVLDGGSSQVGVESTIIDCTQDAPRILRPGAITAQMIQDSTKLNLAGGERTSIRVSGSHAKHYSPRAKVIVGGEPKSGSGFLALAEEPTPSGAIRLASPVDLEQYAAVLYSALRSADEQGLSELNVIPPSGDGLAIAIRDRIQRAAAS